GRPALDHLHAADLDDAVALLPFQAGGFGVEDDLAHGRESGIGNRESGIGKAYSRAFAADLSLMASSRARTSTRSLSGSPEWPFTQRQSMRWRSVAACRRSHRSRFLTGAPPVVFQLRRSQLGIHSVM